MSKFTGVGTDNRNLGGCQIFVFLHHAHTRAIKRSLSWCIYFPKYIVNNNKFFPSYSQQPHWMQRIAVPLQKCWQNKNSEKDGNSLTPIGPSVGMVLVEGGVP